LPTGFEFWSSTETTESLVPGDFVAGNRGADSAIISKDRIMDDFEKISSDHIFRLIYVIRNVANYRSMTKIKNDFNQNFWIQIYNNFFDVAVLEWCKVFGTDSEPTHWKTIVHDHQAFRNGLLSSIGLNDQGWSDFWKNVNSYRNNIIAHFKKIPGLSYPSLDVIIKSTFYYYDWLQQECDKHGIIQEPRDIESYYYRCLKQAEIFSETACNSTSNIDEKVF
jgi:hypothetical protein